VGRRGPKPKPSALKIAQGNPGKRRLNDAEPRPAVSAPTPPEWLAGEALDEWRRIVPELVHLGVIGTIDLSVLLACCEAWAWYRQTARIAAKSPRFVTPAGGGAPYTAPIVNQLRDARADWLKLARELGLTPSARTGLHVEKPAEDAAGGFTLKEPGAA